MQGLVELTVAGPIEPHPDPLARGGRDRGGPAPHGEGGIGPAATRMGPGTQHHGDGSGVLGDLGIEELDAASQGAQAGRGCDGLDIPGGLQPEPPASGLR